MKKIFKFLSSAKFAILVIGLIALLSFIGSFIPHNNLDSTIEFIESLSFGYIDGYKFLNITGFDNIYNSKFFIILLALFTINLILCTLGLIPFARKGFTNYALNKCSEKVLKEFTNEESLIKLIKSSGWKVTLKDKIYKCEKDIIGRYGVITLHIGVIIILIGGFITFLTGYKGAMNILEGTSDNVIVFQDGSTKSLGFELYCNNFNVDYYPNSHIAKSYTSNISIIEDGTITLTKDIDVNNPLTYKGITFYQTTFGIYPRSDNIRIIFELEDNKGFHNIELKDFNIPFKINDNITAIVKDFAPTLALNEDNQPYSASEEMINPAVLLEFYDNNEPLFKGWILKNYPESGNIKELGFNLIFKQFWGIQYTGFTVKKDFGIPIVYTGFIIIIVGILLIYFLNYTAIFFNIKIINDQHIICYKVNHQRNYKIKEPVNKFYKLLNLNEEKS